MDLIILDFTTFCIFFFFWMIVLCFSVLAFFSNVSLQRGKWWIWPCCPFNSSGNCYCLLKAGDIGLKLDVRSNTAVIFQGGIVSLFVWDLRRECKIWHKNAHTSESKSKYPAKKPSRTISEQSERDSLPGHTFVCHIGQWALCILWLASHNSSSLSLCWLDVQ